MTNALTKSTPRQLTKTQLRQLATYTDPGVVLDSLKKAGWTIKKAIENLVDIANNCDKDSTKLAANKYLCQLVTDCMERSGMMVIATKKTFGEDGEEITFTGHIVSSNLQGPNDEHTTMEELTNGDEPQDVKEIENDKKTKKTRKPTKTGKGTAEKGGRKDAGKRLKQDDKRGCKDPSKTSVSGRGAGFTETGLSDDLHTTKPPEVHLDSFKGLAVPPESTIPGPAGGSPADSSGGGDKGYL